MAKKEQTDTIKLTKDEIKELGELRATFSNITLMIGEAEIGFVNLKTRKDELINNLTKLNEKQNDVKRRLENKYGKGNINVDTSEFVPIQE